MNLDIVFRSPKFLLFKAGKRVWADTSDSKRKIIIQENKSHTSSYDLSILRDEDITKHEIVFSINQLRVTEISSSRIVLQDWVLNDCSEPEVDQEIVINMLENKLFNCMLILNDKSEEYIFLNESELHNEIYIWNFNSYNPIKNGVFTERLLNGFYTDWTFINNKKHGEWKSYHKKGFLEAKGYYYQGKLEDEFITYYSNGKLHSIFKYKNGRRNGRMISYNIKGFLELEGNYLNDKKVGKWIYYDQKGEFNRFEDFGEKGEPLFFKELNGLGNLICRECGYTQKITAFLHNLSDQEDRPVTISGYQCQDCGNFHTRTHNQDRKTVETLLCNCGGDIKNDSLIFCPKCKSNDVEYQITLIT